MQKKHEIFTEIQRRSNKQAQKITIIVGTGSSISVDSDFGMDSLENQLNESIPNHIIGNTTYQEEWINVLKRRKEGIDFENSLNEIKSEELLNFIVKETGSFVCRVNRKHILALRNDGIKIPISVLFKKLSNNFSLHNSVIDVITPNYDLLLESAFKSAKVSYTDGFYGNIQKEFNWKESEADFQRPSDFKTKSSKSTDQKWKVINHFRLHKIHGSLNYFVFEDKILRDDTLAFIDIDDINRFIITPGNTKYKIIVETRDFYKKCDEAIENSDCFLFVGYGFNDNDIDIKIRRHLKQKGNNAIIITKKLLGKGKELIRSFPNIIAIEENSNNGGSFIHYQNEILMLPENLWKIDTFVNEILK